MTETIARLEALLESDAAARQYIRLRIRLLEAQADALAATDDEPSGEADRDARRPLLRPEDVRFERAAVGRLLAAIISICKEGGSAGDELDRVLETIRDDRELPIEWARHAAFDWEAEYAAGLSSRLELPERLLSFWGRLAAAPFVIRAAQRLFSAGATVSEEALESESGGACPVCGSPPALAGLRADDGKRILYCSLCGHGWPSDRLACPFRDSGEGAELLKFSVEGEESRWIEACPDCKHYLRTVDARQLSDMEKTESGEIVPLVEEAAGLYLDLLAEREGYDRVEPYAGM